MVHNGIEYGLMQAYAEGFDILQNADSENLPEETRFDLDLTDIAEVWRRGSVISSWLLDLTASALAADPKLAGFEGVVEDSGEGRWTVMAAIEEAVPGGCALGRALRPLPLAPRAHFCREDPVGDAQRLWRPCRAEIGADRPQGQGVMTGGNGAKSGARTAATKARPADPCCLVIFGASGDLTHRLLLPALYNLAVAGLLPEAFALIGVARSRSTSEAFAHRSRQQPARNSPRARSISAWSSACSAASPMSRASPTTTRPIASSATSSSGSSASAAPRATACSIWRRRRRVCANRLHLGESGLAREDNGAWRRVIIEKPFGTDLASARALNQKLLGILKEDQIFRIDHYLGKETVQNIMVLRFANGLFEPIWNRHHIDHVQITVAESLDRRTPRQLL